MPELPEVHTTVEGVKKVAVGKTIMDAWSDFHVQTSHGSRRNIKNKKYYDKFRSLVKNTKIKSAERRGKNILINLSNGHTIIIHMKMTGHLMYGKYKFDTKSKSWRTAEQGPLQDPFNKFIHFTISLSDGKYLVLSDMRKFASVTICKTGELHLHESVGLLGPNPLDKSFTWEKLYELLHAKGKLSIKSALLDQETLAGIGNIYSDEILWETSIHPLSPASTIPKNKFEEIFKSMRYILEFSIKHGGDSKSDYRNIYGEKGGFQNFHQVYGKKGEKCPHIKCKNKKGAIIKRIVVKGRSSHFCPVHQIFYKSNHARK